jgi:hypothetical protein
MLYILWEEKWFSIFISVGHSYWSFSWETTKREKLHSNVWIVWHSLDFIYLYTCLKEIASCWFVQRIFIYSIIERNSKYCLYRLKYISKFQWLHVLHNIRHWSCIGPKRLPMCQSSLPHCWDRRGESREVRGKVGLGPMAWKLVVELPHETEEESVSHSCTKGHHSK